MATNTSTISESPTRCCKKCHVQEATLESRSQPVCRDCFIKFVNTKCVKQIGLLGKETRPPPSTTGGPPTGTRRYLLGLSLGVSSTVLLHLLNENIEFQLARGHKPPFELIVIHIDTTSLTTPASITPGSSPAESLLARYRIRYPRFTFHSIPLSSLLSSPDLYPTPSLAYLLTSPSTSAPSRTDILHILTHTALHTLAANNYNCQALLLGHSTTALAELTLAAAAKGRGWALPWLVQDGVAPGGLSLSAGDTGGGAGEEEVEESKNGSGKETPPLLLVYRPLRDVLRKELVTFAGLTEPRLDDLLQDGNGQGDGNGKTNGKGAVVSHRDLSIEEVMTRYFAEVEESYPSVVANVARTTGKLVRVGGEQKEGSGNWCGLCRMPLDEEGDERWRGELGLDSGARTKARLCYGCERSTVG